MSTQFFRINVSCHMEQGTKIRVLENFLGDFSGFVVEDVYKRQQLNRDQSALDPLDYLE